MISTEGGIGDQPWRLFHTKGPWALRLWPDVLHLTKIPGRVTAMGAGKTNKGWLRSTIIFQPPISETSDSLVPLLAICWVFLLLLQTGSLGPQPPGFEPSELHQESPSGLGCVAMYTSTVKQHSLIECTPGYHAACTGLNLPPSTSINQLGLGGDHTLTLVAWWFLRAVVLSGFFFQEILLGTSFSQAVGALCWACPTDQVILQEVESCRSCRGSKE